MTVVISMESYEARLASFNAVHPATKKRNSEAKGAKSLKWPHKRPSPPQLARAGFFYRPLSSNPDNATCYLCQCNLDGWEEDDSAIDEHLKHSPKCGWALMVSIEKAIEDENQDLENPMTDRMQEARLMTFGASWPHENKRGWKCKTQKMVEAGWYYSPTPESDDYAKCSYCSLSLDGWEPKDNPYDEHRRRSPECKFFHLSTTAVSKTGKPRKSRTSRVSRLSTQSDITIASEAPSIIELDITEGDSINSNSTTGKTAKAKGGKKGGKSKKSNTKRNSRAAKAKIEEPSVASSIIEPEDDDFSVKIDQSPELPKNSKKRTSDQMHGKDDSPVHDSGDEQNQAPPAKRRVTRTRSSVQPESNLLVLSQNADDDDVHMTDGELVPPPPPPASKKSGKGGRKRASTTNRKASIASTASKASLRVPAQDDEAIDAALEVDLDRPLTDDEADSEHAQIKPPKGRRLTRTKPGSRKVPASVAPTRRNTEVDQDLVDDAADKEPSEIPSIALDHAPFSDRNHEAPDDEQAPVKEAKAKGRVAKRTASRKIATKPKPRGKLSKSDPDNPSESEMLGSRKLQDLEQREVPVRKSHRSGPSSSQAPGDIVTNESIMTSDAHITGNDSGDEDDANLATQSHGKSGGRKAAITSKPGKAGKLGRNAASVNANIANTELPAEESLDIEVQDETIIVAVNGAESTNEVTEEAEKPKKASKGAERPPKNKKTNRTIEETASKDSDAAAVRARDAVALKSASPQPPSAHSTPKQAVSPQSSDAENQPPSSRPSALRPPLTLQSPSRSQTMRIPLAVSTPTRSPSKNTFSKLQSSFPWTAVDIEQIFRGTPNADKENNPLGSKDGITKATLTSPEKKMSVEQWIQFNAQRGEEKLRSECEWIVGNFENEGVRALRTLEGIVCAE